MMTTATSITSPEVQPTPPVSPSQGTSETQFLLPTQPPSPLLSPSGVRQIAIRGLPLTFAIDTLQPLERVDVTYTDPTGKIVRHRALRADGMGHLRWTQDATFDRLGPWVAHINGNLGYNKQIKYFLDDLALDTTSFSANGTEFVLFATPGAYYYAYPSVPNGAIRRIASLFQRSLDVLSTQFGSSLPNRIDFFLTDSPEALAREARIAGAEATVGVEAGISLVNFLRDGIYIDMTTPTEHLPHVVAHELSHQFVAAVEGQHNVPHWWEEALADYQGYSVAKAVNLQQELYWRRVFRRGVREAINASGWIDLNNIADPQVWLEEPDVSKVTQFYHQSFTAAEFVANTFGEQALRPLTEALARNPDNPNTATRMILGLTFQEFQQQIQDSVTSPNADEVEIQEILKYASWILDKSREERGLAMLWSMFLNDRPAMTRSERIQRLSGLANAYDSLVQDVAAAPVSTASQDTHYIYLEAYRTMKQSMTRFLQFEQINTSHLVADGNELLARGNFLLNAARDHLVTLLNDRRLSVLEIEEFAVQPLD